MKVWPSGKRAAPVVVALVVAVLMFADIRFSPIQLKLNEGLGSVSALS